MHGFPVFPWSEPKYPSLWPTIKTCKVLQFKIFCHLSLSFYHTHLLFNLPLKYRDSNTETVLFSHIWECNFIQEHYTTLHQQHWLCLVNMRKMTIYADSLWSVCVCVCVRWAQGRLCVFFSSRFLQRMWSHSRVITIPLHTQTVWESAWGKMCRLMLKLFSG